MDSAPSISNKFKDSMDVMDPLESVDAPEIFTDINGLNGSDNLSMRACDTDWISSKYEQE